MARLTTQPCHHDSRIWVRCRESFAHLPRKDRLFVLRAGRDVKNENTATYIRLGEEIAKLATTLPENTHSPFDTSFKSTHDVNALLRWLEKVVKIDLAKLHFIPGHAEYLDAPLSEQAQELLQIFRDEDAMYIGIPTKYKEFVLYAIDKRQVWADLKERQVSVRTIQFAVGSLSQSIHLWITAKKDTLGDFLDESTLSKSASLTDLDRLLPANLPSTNQDDNFRKMPHLAEGFDILARGFYNQGMSEEQVKAAIEHLSDSFQRSILDKLRNEHKEGDNNLNVTTGRSETPRGLFVDTERWGEEAVELFTLFDIGSPNGLFALSSIDLGLTPSVNATRDEIYDVFEAAFGRTLRIPMGDIHSSWLASRDISNTWIVALSYKHKSRQVRMSEGTIKKVTQALADLARSKGFEKIIVWLDTILSVNKNPGNGDWAVNGIYPYLACDVVRVCGKDGEYDDGGESSMWMKVEEECADRRSMTTLTLDSSERGYSWKGSSQKRVQVHERMMNLARGIAKGELVDKLASWKEDKVKLILWAEACMLAGTAVIMTEEELKRLSTLRLDNLEDNEVSEYVERGRKLGFINDIHGRRGLISGWLGLFELFPGFFEASKRHFRPLFDCSTSIKIDRSYFVPGIITVNCVIGGALVIVSIDEKNNIVTGCVVIDDTGEEKDDWTEIHQAELPFNESDLQMTMSTVR